MLNIFTALLKSTYSPADIAKTRFQGIGKAILYVFLLSVLLRCQALITFAPAP
ncbi:DUF1189 family protein [Bacillus velezensis]